MSKIRWWESRRNLGFAGTVVATVVAAALLSAFNKVPDRATFDKIRHSASPVWNVIVYPVPVPLVILVAMVGALLLVGISILKQKAAPAWRSYRQDTFLNIVWRWGYFSDHTLMRSSIAPYCPQCTTALRGLVESYPTRTTFICDECGFRESITGDGDDVIHRLCRIIEREVNRKFPAHS